ncbi:hypothetical protein AVEN_145551-1 [Araneus ventricosus]|uniref:Uncharacterized protein n=1 Tax=Araneus ventricosus TaxID=182803 RepID=A0A4Y2UY54_ARAVE|nr:hypothetical protein AVEN_26358-1 [Araneus ventricosus]GBO17195.1 hypothetical protein AVEN_145551-1 [Araneus ventricosus]
MKGRKIIFFLHILNTNYTHHCGEKGIWRPVKALPGIRKPSIRQPGKSYAQVEADKKRKEEETDEKDMETKTDKVMDPIDLKAGTARTKAGPGAKLICRALKLIS